jgi:hypothetical protein
MKRRFTLGIAVAALSALALIPVGASCGGGSGIGIAIATFGVMQGPSQLTFASVPPGLFQRMDGLFFEQAYADIVGGVKIFQNATVELVEVDSNGDEVSVLETTTTDEEGKFRFATAPGPNQIVRATDANSTDVMRAIVGTGNIELNLDPVSEFIFQEVVSSTAAINGDFSDVTQDEVDALQLQADANTYNVSDVSVGTAVASVAVDPQSASVSALVDGVSTPGSNADRLEDKTFGLIAADTFWFTGGFGIQNSRGDTITTDGAGSFSSSGGAGPNFEVIAGRTPKLAEGDDADTGDAGTYFILDNGEVGVTDDDSDATTLLGALGNDDDIMVLEDASDDSDVAGVVVLVERPTNASDSTLNGDYHIVSMDIIATENTVTNAVTLEPILEKVSATFPGVGGAGTFDGTLLGELDRTFNYASGAVIGANTGSYGTGLVGPGSLETGFPYSVSSDGTLIFPSFFDPGPPVERDDLDDEGIVTADGRFAASSFEDADLTTADQLSIGKGMRYMVLQDEGSDGGTFNTAGLFRTTEDRTYTTVLWAVELDEVGNSSLGGLGGIVERGKLELLANGNATYDQTSTLARFQDLSTFAVSPGTDSIFGTLQPRGPNGYTISDSGELSVTFNAGGDFDGELDGAISPDEEIVILTVRVEDATNTTVGTRSSTLGVMIGILEK